MLMSSADKTAKLYYGPSSFRVLRPGTHVLCAVTGVAIPLAAPSTLHPRSRKCLTIGTWKSMLAATVVTTSSARCFGVSSAGPRISSVKIGSYAGCSVGRRRLDRERKFGRRGRGAFRCEWNPSLDILHQVSR